MSFPFHFCSYFSFSQLRFPTLSLWVYGFRGEGYWTWCVVSAFHTERLLIPRVMGHDFGTSACF